MSRPSDTSRQKSGGTDGVAERLHEAAAHFSPPADALARMDSAVMAEFERGLAAAASAALASTTSRIPAVVRPAVVPGGVVARIRAAFGVRWLRPAFAAALALSLLIGSVAGALASSGPGQPFYRLRLQIEALGLPAPGSRARLQADIDRAAQRLAELVASGQSGDVAATDDSAAAYLDALEGVIAGEARADPAGLAVLLQQHEQLLLRVAGGSPAAARDAVARAVAAVQQAEARVQPPQSIQVAPPASAGPGSQVAVDGDHRANVTGPESREPREQPRDPAAGGSRQESHPDSTGSDLGKPRDAMKPRPTAKPAGDGGDRVDRPGKPPKPPKPHPRKVSDAHGPTPKAVHTTAGKRKPSAFGDADVHVSPRGADGAPSTPTRPKVEPKGRSGSHDADARQRELRPTMTVPS